MATRTTTASWPSLRIVGLVVAVALSSAASCDKRKTSSPDTPNDLDVDKPKPVEHKPTAKVVFRPGKKNALTIKVEVVYKDKDVTQGMMFRRSMPRDQGMLFLMDKFKIHGFWMSNTLIALDIIFLDEDRRVVGILHQMKPMDEVTRNVGRPSRYVVEVNGGWAKANNIGPGTQVKFIGVRKWPPK